MWEGFLGIEENGATLDLWEMAQNEIMKNQCIRGRKVSKFCF